VERWKQQCEALLFLDPVLVAHAFLDAGMVELREGSKTKPISKAAASKTDALQVPQPTIHGALITRSTRNSSNLQVTCHHNRSWACKSQKDTRHQRIWALPLALHPSPPSCGGVRGCCATCTR
jgi:hypothetical protein